MDLNDLLKKISSKGDVAAVSIGFVAGYILDITIVPHGLPLTAAQAAGLGAGAALGIKNGIEAWTHHSDERALQKRADALAREQSQLLVGGVQDVGVQRKELEARCQAAAQLIDKDDLFDRDAVLRRHSQAFRSDLDLWRKHLIDDSAMSENIESLIRHYRDAAKGETRDGP